MYAHIRNFNYLYMNTSPNWYRSVNYTAIKQSERLLWKILHNTINFKKSYVLNRAIDSWVGCISLAGGLVHSGGEKESCVTVDETFGDNGGTFLGVDGTGTLFVGLEGAGEIKEGTVAEDLGGGVCGVSNSSDVRAGLPKPDSL